MARATRTSRAGRARRAGRAGRAESAESAGSAGDARSAGEARDARSAGEARDARSAGEARDARSAGEARAVSAPNAADPNQTNPAIVVSNRDFDALARVSQSEVGHFAKYGFDQLRGGLEAVVDTIINRVSHPNRFFPDTIEAVINKKGQFSAVKGSWTKLPVARQTIMGIVENHLSRRAAGGASEIQGATHFLNPFLSSKSALKNWGNHVVEHAVAENGNRAKKDVHFHGFAPKTKPPDDYTLEFKGNIFSFKGDGTPVQALLVPI